MFGNLVLLKRWHWMAIAVIVGIAAGFAAQPTSLELRADYGNVLNGQREFETGLVRDVQGTPRFKDIVIHRQSVESPSGPSRYVWVISGRYCPGTPDPFDGNLHWKPAVYIAPDPYHPRSNLSELLPGARAGRGRAKGRWWRRRSLWRAQAAFVKLRLS